MDIKTRYERNRKKFFDLEEALNTQRARAELFRKPLTPAVFLSIKSRPAQIGKIRNGSSRET